MSQVDDTEAFLAHYGIKGMKWGFRKEDSGGGSGVTGAGKGKKNTIAGSSMLEIAKQRGKLVEDWGDPTAEKRAGKAKKHQEAADTANARLKDLEENGFKSDAFADRFGKTITKRVDTMSDKRFVALHLKTKDQYKELLNKELTEQRDKEQNTANARYEGKLTRNEKIAIGASVVGLGLVAYGTYNIRQATKDYPPGSPISLAAFTFKTRESQLKAWGGDNVISKAAFNAMDDKDISLGMGTKMQRLAGSAEDSVRDIAYVTHTEADANRYKAIFTQELAGRGIDQIHSMTIRPTTTLTGPSQKKRVQLFADMIMDASKNDETLFGVTRNMGLYMSDTKDMTPQKSLDIALNHYNSMTASQGAKGPLVTQYFDYVKSKGYNMLSDDMDAGVIGDSPIILLQGSAAQVSGSNILSKNEIKAAGKSLTELSNRKP